MSIPMFVEVGKIEVGPAHRVGEIPSFPLPVLTFLADDANLRLGPAIPTVMLPADKGASMVPRFVIDGKWQSTATLRLDFEATATRIVLWWPGRGVLVLMRLTKAWSNGPEGTFTLKLLDEGYDPIPAKPDLSPIRPGFGQVIKGFFRK